MRVEGLGSRVEGVCFRVQGLGFRGKKGDLLGTRETAADSLPAPEVHLQRVRISGSYTFLSLNSRPSRACIESNKDEREGEVRSFFGSWFNINPGPESTLI